VDRELGEFAQVPVKYAWCPITMNDPNMFSSTRHFQVWDYNVTHRQLLLRSPRTDGQEKNLDIVFWGVRFMSIPTVIYDVTLQLAGPTEMVDVFGTNVIIGNESVYKIESRECHGIVVADGCKVLENELEIFDSSLMYVDKVRAQGVLLRRL
jgi:hypothetical protein